MVLLLSRLLREYEHCWHRRLVISCAPVYVPVGVVVVVADA